MGLKSGSEPDERNTLKPDSDTDFQAHGLKAGSANEEPEDAEDGIEESDDFEGHGLKSGS